MRHITYVPALATALGALLLTGSADAAETTEKITSHAFDAKACGAIAMGVAALGGTLGQGRAAASALEGIGRNPGATDRIQVALILGLALIESVVLITVVGAIYLQSV